MTNKIAKCTKVSFSNKAEALEEIKHQHNQGIRFSKRKNSSKSNKKYRAYECPRCGKWHLTTKKQKRKY